MQEEGAIEFERDEVGLVETNVDDVTGEILSRTIERLMSEGAEDAVATPYLGKKGREGFTVRVVCNPELSEKLASVLVEETGTLGVKISQCTRLMVPRKIISIPFSTGKFKGTVRIKVAQSKGKILRIKAELEEAKQIALEEKLPLREVLEQITSSARAYLQKQTKEAM